MAFFSLRSIGVKEFAPAALRSGEYKLCSIVNGERKRCVLP